MNSQEKRVGVFMQLYRNEPSMHKAIKSVLNQTYANFKFYILVSPQTKEQVSRYAKEDSRIEVLDGKQGESSLNYDKYVAGDANAYFTVIDADDWYEITYLEKLMDYAEQYHTDITACGNYFVDTDENRVGVRNQISVCWDTENTGNILPYVYAFFRTIWGKLIASHVILDYKTENFPERKEYGGYGGDTIFMFCLLPETQKMGICGDILYNYRMSPTGGSYTFLEGRLDSDTYVLKYVKKVLKEYGTICEKTDRFLYLVYGEALSDTTKLLLNYNFKEQERAKNLLYIYQKQDTYELFARDNRKKLDVDTPNYFVKRLYDMIFGCGQNIPLEESIIHDYLQIFEILYKKWNHVFSTEEFTILLISNKSLNALIAEDYQELFANLLETLRNAKLDEKQTSTCLSLLQRTTDKLVLKQVFAEKKFVLVYEELLKEINLGEIEQAFKFLRTVFATEDMPYSPELLVELWINYAAENEDEGEFILASEYQIEVYSNEKKIEQARQKYEELKQMGIKDGNMDALFKCLYEEKHV
ncbi:glycosyltransferase [[Ruminococcus] torques]|uniref:glycosyltransferase n=1 Tax=[Ruminococcus] torques TaxID=33039 RepID=UPI00307AB705